METQGPPSLSGGVLKEIVDTPLFKELLISQLKDISPEKSRQLARTFFWGDLELFFSLVSSLPNTLNSLTAALTEAARQMREKLAPDLIRSLGESLLQEIDRKALRECANEYLELLLSLTASSDLPPTGSDSCRTGKSALLAAWMLNYTATHFNALTAKDPQAVGRLTAELTAALNTPALKEAAYTIADIMLDHKFSILAEAWHFFRRRRRRRKTACNATQTG